MNIIQFIGISVVNIILIVMMFLFIPPTVSEVGNSSMDTVNTSPTLEALDEKVCYLTEDGTCSYIEPYTDTIFVVDKIGDKYIKTNTRWYETSVDMYNKILINNTYVVFIDVQTNDVRTISNVFL